MLERQVSVALEGGDGEDDIVKAFDAELHRIVQFYQKKVWPCCRVSGYISQHRSARAAHDVPAPSLPLSRKRVNRQVLLGGSPVCAMSGQASNIAISNILPSSCRRRSSWKAQRSWRSWSVRSGAAPAGAPPTTGASRGTA